MVTCRELCRAEQRVPVWTSCKRCASLPTPHGWLPLCASPCLRHLLLHPQSRSSFPPKSDSDSFLRHLLSSPCLLHRTRRCLCKAAHSALRGRPSRLKASVFSQTWTKPRCDLQVTFTPPPPSSYSEGCVHSLALVSMHLIDFPEPSYKQSNVWVRLYGCQSVYSHNPTWSSPCEVVGAGSEVVISQMRMRLLTRICRLAVELGPEARVLVPAQPRSPLRATPVICSLGSEWALQKFWPSARLQLFMPSYGMHWRIILLWLS